MNFILLAVLSLPLFAQNYTGTFSAVEVEPILVWEYVPEHGGNEWVRRGSKPLKTHTVNYHLKSSHPPALSAAKDIDTKFSSEQLLKTFFKPMKGLITYVSSASYQNGILNAEWLVVDPAKVNETLENTVVVNLRELHFDESLVKIPMDLKVCVKTLGCQNILPAEIKAGTVLLKEIKFKTKVKSLVYIYHWQLKDLWENQATLHSPEAIIEN
jgi:hypothetical protein